jgi:hypothetical protein
LERISLLQGSSVFFGVGGLLVLVLTARLLAWHAFVPLLMSFRVLEFCRIAF